MPGVCPGGQIFQAVLTLHSLSPHCTLKPGEIEEHWLWSARLGSVPMTGF